jgi:hypothetical protein
MSSVETGQRINNYIERIAIGLLVILLSLVQTQYWADKAESKQEIKELNTKVLELYRNSVTKQELRELETRLTENGNALRSDVRQILTLYLDQKK